MAVIRKRGKSWQALVRLKGHDPVSATRATKREAEEWAKQVEGDILAGRRGKFPAKTLGDAFRRYELEVSVNKRGRLNEAKRLEAIRRDFPELVAKHMHQITPADLSAWRDARLKVVKAATVNRDIKLLRNIWTVAAREWLWCEPDVWKSVRSPGESPPRQALWGWRDMRRMLRRLNYRTGLVPGLAVEEIAYLFLIGLHTAMRHGEIRSLRREDVDLERRVITLGTHKTMEKVGVRRVPITRRAARVLKVICDQKKTGPLFTVSAASADALFRKYRHQAMVEGLTFHDSRATALTLLARKVDVLTLSRISGHRDIRLLSTVYYRESAEDIARRI